MTKPFKITAQFRRDLVAYTIAQSKWDLEFDLSVSPKSQWREIRRRHAKDLGEKLRELRQQLTLDASRLNKKAVYIDPQALRAKKQMADTLR